MHGPLRECLRARRFRASLVLHLHLCAFLASCMDSNPKKNNWSACRLHAHTTIHSNMWHELWKCLLSRRFRATLLLHTTCVRSCCTWRASSVVAKHLKKQNRWKIHCTCNWCASYVDSKPKQKNIPHLDTRDKLPWTARALVGPCTIKPWCCSKPFHSKTTPGHNLTRTDISSREQARATGGRLPAVIVCKMLALQSSGNGQAGMHEQQPSNCWDSTHHNQMSTLEHALPWQLHQLHVAPTIYKQHFSPLPAAARSPHAFNDFLQSDSLTFLSIKTIVGGRVC